jgi:hypothetical protein
LFKGLNWSQSDNNYNIFISMFVKSSLITCEFQNLVLKLKIKLSNTEPNMSSTVQYGCHSAIWTVLNKFCFTGSITCCHVKMQLWPSNPQFTLATLQLQFQNSHVIRDDFTNILMNILAQYYLTLFLILGLNFGLSHTCIV